MLFRSENIHVHDGIGEEEFVAMRVARDATLDVPTLILPSMQVNVRAGARIAKLTFCGTVRLANGPLARNATVLGRDEAADLAVLRSELATENSLMLREAAPRAAEPVLVAGFPLQSLLASGPQVSTGIVTALAGMRDDASRIQISAPIQPGNSGGPVLDREGRVLGVAASTLGTLAATIATGDRKSVV